MGKTYEELSEPLVRFIAAQRVFFVATAPRADDGHVNLSPKGLGGFCVLSPRRVAYADLTGSGVETIAHVRENGRLTIMFCAFEGPPNILRLYGRARVVEPGADEFETLLERCARPAAPSDTIEPPTLAAPLLRSAVRAVIVLEISRITDSCGFGVPRYEYVGERELLPRWVEKKGADGVRAYQREKNRTSIDALPGLRRDDALG